MSAPKGSFICFLDEHDSPNSLIVGGYFIPKYLLAEIDNHIIAIKKYFNLLESDPIKWNLRDSSCQNAGRLIKEKRVNELRFHIFSIVDKIPIQVIMSQVWKGKAENLEEAWKWAFIDILQRLCIDIERKQDELAAINYYPFLDVVFDWFPGGKKIETYFDIYQNAYLYGYKFEGNELKPLRDFKACPCLLVTSVKYSNALQLADFFFGATADFFKWCYEGHRLQNVKNYFPYVHKAFRRGDNNEVLGFGLITKKESRDNIILKLKEIGLES